MIRHDENEFIGWYDAHSDAIFRFCYFRVHDYERAKDLVQEVYTRVWRHIQGGHILENPRAFLYRVALNCIINDARKKSSSATTSLDMLEDEVGFDPPDPSLSEAHLQEGIDAARIAGMLDTLLDAKHKDVLVMRFINDLSPKEIAAITGESENVVSVRIHRALKKVRMYLETYETNKS